MTVIVEVQTIRPELAESLGALFAAVVASGDGAAFHPHPLTREYARELAEYRGEDLYRVAVVADRVLGYGIARGFDSGYDVPSLGVAVHPDARGKGIASLLIEELHTQAKAKGARAVRLRVHPRNERARRLYERLGYTFNGALERGQLVGTRSLEDEG